MDLALPNIQDQSRCMFFRMYYDTAPLRRTSADSAVQSLVGLELTRPLDSHWFPKGAWYGIRFLMVLSPFAEGSKQTDVHSLFNCSSSND